VVLYSINCFCLVVVHAAFLYHLSLDGLGELWTADNIFKLYPRGGIETI